MHKTIGGSIDPNIGSKTKIFQGVALDPIKWGYGYASNPLWHTPLLHNWRNEGGAPRPL